MPKTQPRIHHPALYFSCNGATMTLDDKADIFELRKMARMFVCRKNGASHYLVITPYSEADKTEEGFEEWRKKMMWLLSTHCIEVRDITYEDAETINAWLGAHPEYFGRMCLKLTYEERKELFIPTNVLSMMSGEKTEDAGG